VLIALVTNAAIAAAKSVAGVLSGSASMVAEAVHSWADTGNEVFLLIADRRSRRPADDRHPLGHGREAYVWALLAAVGLFVVGASVSVWHGVNEIMYPRTKEVTSGSPTLSCWSRWSWKAFRWHRPCVSSGALSSRSPRARSGDIRPDDAGGLRRGHRSSGRNHHRVLGNWAAPADRQCGVGRDAVLTIADPEERDF
jgi:hypothetical protein